MTRSGDRPSSSAVGRGHLIKALCWDGQGLCLFVKRLEKGRFVWPPTAGAAAALTPAQLAMLLEGIDWRAPVRMDLPCIAGCCAGAGNGLAC